MSPGVSIHQKRPHSSSIPKQPLSYLFHVEILLLCLTKIIRAFTLKLWNEASIVHSRSTIHGGWHLTVCKKQGEEGMTAAVSARKGHGPSKLNRKHWNRKQKWEQTGDEKARSYDFGLISISDLFCKCSLACEVSGCNCPINVRQLCLYCRHQLFLCHLHVPTDMCILFHVHV